MKKMWMMTGVLATLLTGTALAQTTDSNDDMPPPPMMGVGGPQGGPGGPGSFGGRRFDPDQVFKSLDGNGDGYVTKAEMMKAHQERFEAHFKTMDANGDGKLTQAEMDDARQNLRNKMQSRMQEWRGKGGQRGPGQGRWAPSATDSDSK